MRILFSIIFILLLTDVQAQSDPKLFYFISGKKIGVKDNTGRVIIEPIFSKYLHVDLKHPILDDLIEFYSLPDTMERVANEKPAIVMGTVYNRKGQLLYHAQFCDNGPDYWEEGLRRYVEGYKIGFVDKQGNKVTSAKWDFANPFEYGYAKVFEGDMRREYEYGGEHWYAVGDTVSYLINRKGERVTPSKTALHPKDYLYDGLYYPYPFSYTDDEQKILDKISAIPQINKIYAINREPKQEYTLQFEITERPTKNFAYYTIEAYDNQQNTSSGIFGKFYANAKGEFFIRTYAGDFQPLASWIAAYD